MSSPSTSSSSIRTKTMCPDVCVPKGLNHIIYACFLLLTVALVVNATPHFLSEDDLEDGGYLSLDKRPARLSYFRERTPSGGGYGRRRYNSYSGYSSHSYGGKNDWWRKKAVNRHNMPWENLPNTNCLRQYCRSDNDCCRRHSKCNEEAHVCYDCWYGHPCKENMDCCERYPICNKVLHSCGK
ncbi:unnamed protein product [Candidula unifasciata]|uniref:Uncharacterized protein n=1 Tax=Candidula unifasciata TaxID=100452 RepID=A0A8S4A016_9EUPU|nr:unnamed protein product [Candidula unifasciata]